MALVVKDRVLETSVTTGTGTFTLDGTLPTYQTFASIGSGNTTYYAIVSQVADEWEVGLGTYTSSGTTLSRDTILSSSASGAAVNFSAGVKNVFSTYPSEKAVYLDATDESNSALTIGTTPIKLGETVTTLAGLDSVEVTQDPTTSLQLATKQYVDTQVSSGIHFHQPVRVESPINLNATYNNGTAGVGATLTNAGTQAALVIDGITLNVADRVLVYQQTTQTQNGVYVVTNVGSGSTNWILTRSTDTNTYANASPNGLSEGSTFFVQQGATGAGEMYTCNTVGTITFGTTNITFAQISSAQIYSAGTGLTLTGTQFSITNTAVTPASYGSASKTLTATVNAQGQLTALADTNIAIQMSQVTSGTLGVTQGGTGFSSYSVGDLIYADTTTSFAKLAGVATGNVLLSGGLGAAPLYGKVDLTTAVSGTLPVANGGTGTTTSTGSGNVVLSTSPTLVTPILGTPQSGNFSTGTFTWPTFNQNTTGTAGNVSGVVAIANGGTGETTRQAAMDALAGATTSGQYLRGNGTDVVMSAIQASDVPTLNQNTTGTAAGLSATLAVSSGGTGQTTANAAFNALAPSQTGNSGRYLTTNGTNTSWAVVPANVASFSAGTTGFTPNTATTGAVTLSGTLATTNGGTNLTSFTSGGLLYATSTSALTTGSTLTFASSTLTAPNVVASNGMLVNSNTVSASYAIPSGSSAIAAGPITVASGATVTIPSGSRWVVL
jgi:hypothetical protein